MRLYEMWTHFFRSWSKRTRLQITTLYVLSGVFTILVLCCLFYQNFNHLVQSWGQSFEMNVFLNSSLSKKEIFELEKLLKSKEEVQNVKWISKDEALKIFALQMPKEAQDLLLDSKNNPLPHHFQISVKKKYLGLQQNKIMEKLYQEFSHLKGVESTSYTKSILKNYSLFFKRVHQFGFFLITFLLIGSLFIIGNSIRGSLIQRKEEITILKSMGSTIGNISGPFIFEGALMGFLSSLLSLSFSYALFLFQASFFDSLFAFFPFHFQLKYLDYFSIFLLLGLGLSFGALGSYLCVREVYNEEEEHIVEWEKNVFAS